VTGRPGDDAKDKEAAEILTLESQFTANRSIAVDECTDDSLREILQFALSRKRKQIKASASSLRVLEPVRPQIQIARGAAKSAPAIAGNVVEYRPMNHRLTVSPDTTLLAAALKAEIPLRHDCGGNGQCGTCRVKVLSGGNNLSPYTPPEQKLLSNLLNQNWRLACQVKTRGPVAVDVPPSTK
jgi:ferredoxin